MTVGTFAKEYAWQLQIASYQIGANGTLRPSDILRLQQEVGNRHLSEGGLTVPAMRASGVAFVLARTNCLVHRAPVLDESVVLTSWQREIVGSKFLRCYHWASADGTPLIDSVSAFVLVDVDKHRPVRPLVLTAQGVRLDWQRQSPCPDPEKLALPPTFAVGERVVRRSDTDFNGHVNNAVYADVLCDFLPAAVCEKRMTGFSISFLRESRLGDVLQVQAKAEETVAFVAAEHARGRSFEAKATFAP